jgi:hypothetical protein
MSGDHRSVRGYRAATDALEERPSTATRAAILAAAARQVQAGPRDAREPIAAPRRITSRKRWPYAAAAAVLLSSLAVMMATRTEREMPTFTAPVERTAESAAPSKPVPSSEPPPPAAAPPASQEIASAPATVTATAEKQAKADSSRAGPVPSSEAKVALPSEAPRAKEEVAALRDVPAPSNAPAPAAAPPPPATGDAARPAMPTQLAKRQAAPASEATERRRNESADMASAERSTLQQAPAAPPAAGLGAATGSVRAEADASTAPPASEWLERIIKLRRAGRHDEANVELKRFRESYPQVTVPAEALPATGTR